MQTGIIRGMSVLAGLLWLASCSSSPKSRDYPGYMIRPYTIRGHRYHPMNVEQALTYEQTGIASHYNESEKTCAPGTCTRRIPPFPSRAKCSFNPFEQAKP